MSGWVDPELADRVGDAAGRALVEHAVRSECDYHLHRWFENGRTPAVVGLVREVDRFHDRTVKLVLKTVGGEDEPIEANESTRHRRALKEAPEEFARAHLTQLWGEPVRVGTGTWLAFQEIAGDGGDEIEPMGVLLEHALGQAPAGRPLSRLLDITPVEFAKACGSVVDSVLREWAGPPHTPESVDLTAFLGRHLGNHLTSSGPLLSHARQHIGRTISLDGEPGPLPNPFALATGAYFEKTPVVPMLAGRSHGDLHVENILMTARPQVDDKDFFLVDLARYGSGDPLTRDPVHLVLHVLARRMADVPDAHRHRLIDLLLDPGDTKAREILPSWIVQTVTAVDSAGRRWAAEGRLVTEWRSQTRLSLTGCALRFIGRESTREEDRAWFLRLASRAAAEFLSADSPPPAPPTAVAGPEPAAAAGAMPAGMSARAAFLRRALHVKKMHQEVRRTLVDQVVVPAMTGPEPGVVVVRGDAGAGKSTIAGQVYDAIAERDGTAAVVVPCQHIDALPESVDGLDETVGALVEADGPVSVAIRRIRRSGARPVVILDTVDNLLEQRTAGVIVDLLARLVHEGASVVLTTRPFHYHAWVKPFEARLGGAMRAPVSVPHLSREEVVALVSGYLVQHPSEYIVDTDGFGGDIWELSADRPGMQLIVRNPYLLLMLCETYSAEGVVPPEMTMSRLCDQYVRVRVYGSRKYPEGHPVLTAKRRLWQMVAGELWRRSDDRLALVLPQSWLDKHCDDNEALHDLLSEEVLVRSEADRTSVQFNHQFLAEFSVAIYLRDHGVGALHSLLDVMRDAPGSHWFAWPVVRHVLARAHTPADIDSTLDRMDLAESYAYQAAAHGLVEQSSPGYLVKLGAYKQNYLSLFEYQVLHFVDDAKISEALALLTEIMLRGNDECAAHASTVAGRLAARPGAMATADGVTALNGLVDAVCTLRGRRTAAGSRDAGVPDQLLENLLGPLTNRGVVAPADLLAKTRSVVAEGTPVGMRAVIRLHLVTGVPAEQRQLLLTRLLAFRFANKVGEPGTALVTRTVEWDVSPPGTEQANGDAVRPAVFLRDGGKSSAQLRAAALAVAARDDPRLRHAVVEAFVTLTDSGGIGRALMCVQEVVKGGGQAWLLAELAAQPEETLTGIAFRLGGLVKSVAAHVGERAARHAWADWLAPLVAKGSYGVVDGYLQLGWDDHEHLRTAVAAFGELPMRQRESVVANFTAKLVPGKAAIARDLLRSVPDANPLLLVRTMDISGDDEPAGLVEYVAWPARLVSAHAMTRLEEAARSGRPWMRPELLDRYADNDDAAVRVGVLKSVAVLVRATVGDVDNAVVRWVGSAADRHNGGGRDTAEEHVQLITLCHSYLRDGRGSAPAALRAVTRYVGQMVAATVPPEASRELLALVKTAASRADAPMRETAAKWMSALMDRIDIGDVREGRAFAKETLGKLVERGHVTLAELTTRTTGRPPANVNVVVDVIASHDPAGEHSLLLDALWETDASDEVRAHIAAIRIRQR
ncbi:NACHT domain protein [Actinokineospora sp. UTMC 2448]|nr:NACHT domain protein [Actinokineospora sp. UTMC 2448]